MAIVYDEAEFNDYARSALEACKGRPILIDKFLEGAVEVDVDCLCDGKRVVIGGVMQHIEEAGIHSGDSACVIPAHSLSSVVVEEIKRQARVLAFALNVKGLMNIQFAVKPSTQATQGGRKVYIDPASLTSQDDFEVYILEANPRASRTIPFVSKATGVSLARLAALVMVGQSIGDDVKDEVVPTHYSVKESVFPFNKFAGVDIILGPEMKSTGEVMGIDDRFPMAFAKAQLAANAPLPTEGTVFLSVGDQDKLALVPVAQQLAEMGYDLLATRGTAKVLKEYGIPVTEIAKIQEGRPNLIDRMKNGDIAMIINTPSGQHSRTDEWKIRSAAVAHRVTSITTMSAAYAVALACRALREEELTVMSLQERFPTVG
jgi:carbamoyl-phosphate synthase large subunit